MITPLCCPPIRRKYFITLLILTLLQAATPYTAPLAAESVPPLINYQGALTDANGAPMAGVKSMEFNLYDAPTGGNLIWGPQIYATVPLIGGKFNVLLGPTDGGGKLITTAFADKTRYLSITIEGKEILPRQQILSTPYAIQAQEATHARKADEATDTETRLNSSISSLQAQINHLNGVRLNCITVVNGGRIANCPGEYTAVSCSAGRNLGSHNIEGVTCRTDSETDWTLARCCRVLAP